MLAIKRFRMLMLAVWVVAALLVVGTALAQDGSAPPEQAALDAGVTPPQDLDDIAVKLAPLLVGAALIERTLEFLFNWVERAILDASTTLHVLLSRVTGLVQIDLHDAWKNVTELSTVLTRRQAHPEMALNDPESANPEDWPLALLEERLSEARDLFEKAQAAIEAALDSPLYVARKKVTAMVLSTVFGIALAVIGSLRLFLPLGVGVAEWIATPFRVFDMVLAGVLMGLGTDWVHQVIGLLVNGKGLLGRAATGSQMDTDQVAALASAAVQENIGRQLEDLRGRLVGDSSVAARTESAMASAVDSAVGALTGESPFTHGLGLVSASMAAPAAAPAPTASTASRAAPAASAATERAALEGFLPLDDVSVTVRDGGTSARAEPSLDAEALGAVAAGSRHEADGLVFGDYTWLRTPWEGPEVDDAWLPGEDTDFPRSAAYNQVQGRWYDSPAILDFRRTLVRDLLRVRSADREQIAEVDTLSGAALEELEIALTRETIPAHYQDFWAMQLHLGLPDPFAYLPVQASPPGAIEAMGFSGFGPSTYALNNWMIEYEQTRGLHPGVDYLVPEGTPLIAVADGVIVAFDFLHDPADHGLALRPFLPDKYRRGDGSRVLSNIVIGYGHVAASSAIVRVGQEVRAGEIIGSSGWPVFTTDEGTVIMQRNNAHLHLEAHFVTDGTARLEARVPLNPLLLFTPRLVAWQARLATQRNGVPYPSDGQPFGRLGFFSVGAFDTGPDSIVWDHRVTRSEPWPEGVYPLDRLVEWARRFEPYPLDGTSPF